LWEREREESKRSGARTAFYSLGLIIACSHDHVHGAHEYISKAWLTQELTGKSLSALVIVIEEAVSCVLGNGVKDTSDVGEVVS